jgi:hypothetical protein
LKKEKLDSAGYGIILARSYNSGKFKLLQEEVGYE